MLLSRAITEMNKPKKRDIFFYIIMMTLFSVFLASVYSSEKEFTEHHQQELEKTSSVISGAVWTMYTEASDLYLQQAVHDRDYKTLEVYTINNTLTFSLDNVPGGELERLFLLLGLITTADFSADIYYSGEKIGRIEAVAYNMLIFKHLNNLLITALLAVLLWFGKKLHESKTDLEQRVKKRTDELRNSEKRYKSMFRESHAVMLVIDPASGRLIDANKSAELFYGYSAEKLKKMLIYEININPADIVAADMEKAKSGHANRLYMKHKLASGEVRDVEIYSGPVDFNGNIYLMSIIHDITERRQAEKQIIELNMTLQERVRTEIDKNRKQEEIIHNQKKLADMGNMISAISHQWRQPLNALGFYVQDITDALGAGEADLNYAQKFEEESMNIINHLSTTIDDFRYFFQPDKDATELKTVDEIYSLLRLTLAQLQNSHISVSLICRCKDKEFISENLNEKPECDCNESVVKGYAGEFKQVMANLIYNAIDAIKSAGIKNGRIAVEITSKDQKLIIKVSDNGGGIPEAITGNIFTPYFSTKKDNKGTGIGLYMSKAIIEEHMNGKIRFENIPSGVCFIIELPVFDKNINGGKP